MGDKAYAIALLLGDLRDGIFTEWKAAAGIKVDPYRRNLQRGYIEVLGSRLGPPPPPAFNFGLPDPAMNLKNDDSRGAIRAELKALRTQLTAKAALAADKTTKNHLEDLKDQISQILEPKPAAAPTQGIVY